jgi:hypothetical protein
VRCAKLLFEVGYALALTAAPAALGGCSGDASLGADDEPFTRSGTAGTSSPGPSPAQAGGPSMDVPSTGGVDRGAEDNADANTGGGSPKTNEGGAVSAGGSSAPLEHTGGTSAVPEPTGGTAVVEGSGGTGGAERVESTGGQHEVQDTGGQQQIENTGGQQQALSAGSAGTNLEGAAGWGGAVSDPSGAGPEAAGAVEDVCTVTECAVRRECVEDCSSEDVTSTCCVCETLGMIDSRICL